MMCTIDLVKVRLQAALEQFKREMGLLPDCAFEIAIDGNAIDIKAIKIKPKVKPDDKSSSQAH